MVVKSNRNYYQGGCFEYSYAIVKDNIHHLKISDSEKQEMKEEHQNFVKTLTYLGIDVMEVSNTRSDRFNQATLNHMIGDLVFIINGVALFLQPHDRMREREIQNIISLLKNDFFLHILEIKDPNAFISAQDILFTGKEIFIGINNRTTNHDGALIFANAFVEYSTQVIKMPHYATMPLRNYVSIGDRGVLMMSRSDDASKSIANTICLKARFNYEFIDLPDVKMINSLFLNNTLIHLDVEDSNEKHSNGSFSDKGKRISNKKQSHRSLMRKSATIIDENLGTHASLNLTHLLKKSANMSSLCILIPKYEVLQHLETLTCAQDFT